MAKRFADTELWDKQWFMDLPVKHKCLVQFLFAKCDPAGVWSANYTLASSFIGEKITVQDLDQIADRVRLIAPGKYFIIDFIEFQYVKLSPACKPHIKILELLDKYNIDSKGYPKGIHTLQEKDKDKDKEKEKGVQGETIEAEEYQAAIGYEMSQSFLEINPAYVKAPSRDMPAIIEIAQFIHSLAGGNQKEMHEMDTGERRTIMREWQKFCHWYQQNAKNKPLDFLVKFKLQEIFSEIKNGKNASDKRDTEKHKAGKYAGRSELLASLKKDIAGDG